ncbi:MAG: hypothetical protein KGO50_06740 [Myxococcales bacterium]|nr:hypothetical protein [Myxococcales bacterium]
MTPPDAPPQPSTPPPRASWAPAFVVGALTLVMTLVPLLRAPWIFSNDGAEHLYSAWILANHGALSPSEQQMVQTHQPWSASFFPAVWGVASWFLGWKHAFLTSVMALATMFHVASAAFLLQRQPQRWPLLAALPCVTFGWMFHMGFYNFLGGLALAMLVQVGVLHVTRWKTRHTVLLALALLLVGACHPLAAVMAGVLVVLTALFKASGPDRSLGPVATIAAGLPVFALVLWQTQLHVTAGHQEVAAAALITEPWLWFVRTGVVGPALLSAGSALAALLGVATWLRHLRTAPGVLRQAESLSFWVAFAAGLLWALAPFSTGDWEGLSPRFAPLAILAGWACLPVGHPRLRPLLLTVGLLAGAACAVWHDRLYDRLQLGCQDFLQAMDSAADLEGAPGYVTFGGCDDATQPIDEARVPYAEYTLHLGAALAVAHTTVWGGFQGNRAAHTHSVLYPWHRLPDRQLNPVHHAQLMRQLLAGDTDPRDIAAGWFLLREYVASRGMAWVHGPDTWLQRAFPQDEFRTVTQVGDLRLVQHRSCALDLRLEGDVQRATRIDHGWQPLPVTQPWETLDFGQPLTAGTLHLGTTTCGPMWVQARSLDGTPVPCLTGNGAGPLLLPAAAPETTRAAVCRLVPPTAALQAP